MTEKEYTQQPPPPDPELQRLAPLLGTWNAVGQSNAIYTKIEENP